MAKREHFMGKVAYGGWPNCVRVSNGLIELVATTDVGPRVIRFGFVGGQNVFCEFAEMLGKTGGDEWRIYGGHRLWHAPESNPRTYYPDNQPVKLGRRGKTLSLDQDTEPTTGIAKNLRITMDSSHDRVTIVHRLTNRGLWPVTLAPWALSVMAPGGRAILPQEPFKPHTEDLLPARPLVLWSYADMRDPRWTWGTKYIQLRQDPKRTAPQKIGLMNSPGWAAYTLGDSVFIKRFGLDRSATYPDMGCNFETFTNERMLELESLGPLTRLAPGESVEHTEEWFLFRADIGPKEDEIDARLLPLLDRFAY